MPALDLRTVVFGYVLSDLVCLLAIGGLWLRRRKRSTDLNFWLASYGMQLLGLLLAALRDRIPDLLSIVVSNTLVLTGTLLLLMGLERYAGKVRTHVHNYLLLLVFVALQTFFTFARPSVLARNLNLNVGLLLLCAQAAWFMLAGVKPDLRLASRPVGAVFATYVAVSAGRIFVDLSQPAQTNFWNLGASDIFVILTYQMLFIALTFGLLIMRNLRAVDLLESDSAAHVRAEGELRTLSILDPLTGLYNRSFFEEQLARLERANRFPVSVLVVDLVGLEQVNDRHGHAAGDSLIERAAGVLRSAFRADDTLARIDSDKFAVLLPNVDASGADVAVRRAHLSLEQHNAAHPGNPVHLSLGSSTSGKGESLSAAIRRADGHMYREKRARRA